MPTWTLVSGYTNPDTFTRANGAVGNGWLVVGTNVFSISSNTLAIASNTGYLYRPASEASQDQRHVFRFVCQGSGNYYLTGVRFKTSFDGYYVTCGATNDGNVYLNQFVNGTTTGVGSPISTTGFVAGKTYEVDLSAVGVNPTTLTVVVTNITDSVVLTNTTRTDSTAALQGGAGTPTLQSFSSGGGVGLYSATYSAASALTAGTASLTSAGVTTASLTCTVTSGGTSPYTYQWYRSTTSGFTPSGGNLVSGATSLTLNDTGLTTNTTYYYKLVVTDAASATATSNQVAATPSAPAVTVAFNGVTIGAQNAANTNHTITVATGTSPYTAVVYRSITSGFTVPSTATVISGGASVSGSTITVTDTTGTPGQLYFYKTVITDTNSQTLTTNQIAGIKALNKLQILFVGDSITASYNTAPKTVLKLKELLGIREVNYVNGSVSGSRTNDWISGSSNLTNAKAAAVTAFGTPTTSNLVYVSVMLSVNDCRVSPPGNSASTVAANLLSLCNDLTVAGYAGVILHAPPLLRIPQGVSNTYDSEAGMANLLTYPAAMDSICSGKIIKGDRQATNYFGLNWGEFVVDAVGATATYVHPNGAGEDSYAAFWSKAIVDALYPNRQRRSLKL